MTAPDQFQQLEELRRAGILSEAEFANAWAKALAVQQASESAPYYPPPPAVPIARADTRWPWIVAVVVAVVGVAAIAFGFSAGGSSRKHPTASHQSAATPAVNTTEPTLFIPSDTPSLPPPLPDPADFKIAVKIRSKECFGSAGCNITYQIHPVYVGPLDISSGSYDVTYEVLGGDSGPQINTFTIDSGTASVDEEELISTSSAGKVLIAKATDVQAH